MQFIWQLANTLFGNTKKGTREMKLLEKIIKMNDKIKQLALQAGQGEPFHIPPEFIEKFAELIVKECIDYCGENLPKTVGGALKIHFGVEE